ncbi:Voltage-gated potassium channel subunit beta-2 [Phytophthora megakarya]|uniref:Voltage-gated potassium channel subunit beta-2 n=1 Tax=Phytophthora megakarya TaxID=4795 RepID=A0A225VU68_9STRA|nr:Voltage-gated potassium channel subunit beta-2 [Phytophthora megakarya]
MAPAASDTKSSRMTYRFLGNSGLMVSKLSLDSWMDVNDKYTADAWYDMMKLSFEHGINFFDNAEAYGGGIAEKNMGAVIKKGIAEATWSSEDFVITTKLFFGAKEGFTGRKHILEGTKASFKRFEQEYVNVIFCHRADSRTPIEETIRVMNYVINQGWTFYWGTSQWSSAVIIEACEIADRLGLANKLKPVADKLGISMAELALAWCVSNENVSTVMIGAKTPAQPKQNLKAIEAVDKITSDIKAEIDELVPFVPELPKPDGSEMIREQHL